MRRRAPQIVVSQRQKRIMEKQCRAHQTSQQMVLRRKIILEASKGLQNIDIAAELGVDQQRVGRWRRRWAEASDKLKTVEETDGSERDLVALIDEILSDSYRSGAPPKFTAEQMTQLVALACEKPEDSDYPVTHWTPKELAAEAIKRKIVPSISIRHLDRFLK